jgi:hypothetical protein
MSEKNIFFTKIFQAFANNNNLVDKDLFHHFIAYTDSVKYDPNEVDYNGLYDLINIARKNGDYLVIESEIPIKSGNIALVYNAKLNGKNVNIRNIDGPLGVMGRTSDNKLIKEVIGWVPDEDLESGLIKTYKWIDEQIQLGLKDAA